MTNTNCLEGIRCPKCGHVDRFLIAATITAEVTDDGADIAPNPRGDIEWDDDSRIECPECDRAGTVGEFKLRLPPDPEAMNGKRAAWAGTAITAFMKETGTDEEDALGDLLGDLMHWSDRNNFDFEAALERARGHYEAETAGEEAA